MGQKSFRISMFLAVIFFAFNYLYAQTFDLQYIPKDEKQFGFSYNRAFYKNSINFSTLSGVYQLYIDIPVSSKLNLIGNIPYISKSYNVNFGFGEYSYSANGIGNIFIGLQSNQKSNDNGKDIITFGLYLPTGSEDASYNGTISDYYHMSKYIPNSIGIYFNYAFHKRNNDGFNYGLEIGPNVISPTKRNSFTTEFFAHYGIITGYQVDQISLNLEFVGNVVISEDIEEFGDRFVNMLNFGAQWMGTAVTPRIYYKIYLRDEMRQMVDGVLGVGVNLSID